MRNQSDERALGGKRFTVGSIVADSGAEATGRWERAPAGGYASGAERGVMDSGDRGAVAGDARQVPAVSNLPSAVSAVGAGRVAGEGVEEVGRTVTSRRPIAFGRSLH